MRPSAAARPAGPATKPPPPITTSASRRRSARRASQTARQRLDRSGGRPQRVAAVDPAHLDEVDLVAGGRHQLGLDPLARAEEGDLGAASPKLVGDRHGRHDVTGGSPRCHHDSCASGTARSAPSTRGRAPTLDDAQFASAGGPPAGDVEDQADREQGRHQAAVAVGDEGQRHAGQRRQPHHREEVDRRLDEDQRGEAGDEQLAVVVLRFLRRLQAGVAEQREEADDADDPDQAQLLADHRRDHVGVGLGQVEGLLHAVADADPEEAAGAERDLRLRRLEAGAGGVGARG